MASRLVQEMQCASTPQTTCSVTFQRELWSTALHELEGIFPEHARELSLDSGRFAPIANYPLYEWAEKSGMLVVVTVRASGELVGYYIGSITPHLHYRD